MSFRNFSIPDDDEVYLGSRKSSPVPTTSNIAKSLNELAKLIGRTDGYNLNIVREVRHAIITEQPHKLRVWIEEPERYKKEFVRHFEGKV